MYRDCCIATPTIRLLSIRTKVRGPCEPGDDGHRCDVNRRARAIQHRRRLTSAVSEGTLSI